MGARSDALTRSDALRLFDIRPFFRQYDLSVSTFSPDGRVFQSEYAQKAVDASGTVLGMCCKDGVLLAAEKLELSKLLEENSNRRTFPIDKHAGAVIAGVSADGRAIIDRAQGEASNYKSMYGDAIPGSVLADRVASYVHVFNLYWYDWARPPHARLDALSLALHASRFARSLGTCGRSACVRCWRATTTRARSCI